MPTPLPVPKFSLNRSALIPSYSLNLLPIASDMRGRIADLPDRVRAEETLWELAFRAKPPR